MCKEWLEESLVKQNDPTWAEHTFNSSNSSEKMDYFFGLDGAGTGCAFGTLGGVSASRTERSA